MTRSDYFGEEELYLVSMYDEGSREQTISAIKGILPFVSEDPEITTLAQETIRKLEQISDTDYREIDLELYRQEAKTERE